MIIGLACFGRAEPSLKYLGTTRHNQKISSCCTGPKKVRPKHDGLGPCRHIKTQLSSLPWANLNIISLNKIYPQINFSAHKPLSLITGHQIWGLDAYTRL
jgi:hypothetical protein